MKEIGSEFWTNCSPLNGLGVKPLLPKGFNTFYTLCGRTALEIIVSDILSEKEESLKVYMPSYCCHTMIEPFISHEVEVQFYDVVLGKNGIEKKFDVNNNCDIVFLLDYFGYVDSKTVNFSKIQKERGKIVIYDSTHSFFCYNLDYSHYDYVFGSFRKWIGVNAGFCSKQEKWLHTPILSQNTRYTNARNTSFALKAQFMADKEVDKQIFLNQFSKAEESLETDYKNYAADEASLQITHSLNVEYLRTRRRENAVMLINAFSKKNALVSSMPIELSEQDCPLFVPLNIDSNKRAQLRNHLAKNQCYLPCHWPVSNLHCLNDTTSFLYEHELSCICDQRYDTNDIKRLIDVITCFI